jgi:hypothetical protein
VPHRPGFFTCANLEVIVLISEAPGPWPDSVPPDVDGRRDTDAPGFGRAALDAQLQARASAGMGGTIVSGLHDGFGPPR